MRQRIPTGARDGCINRELVCWSTAPGPSSAAPWFAHLACSRGTSALPFHFRHGHLGSLGTRPEPRGVAAGSGHGTRMWYVEPRDTMPSRATHGPICFDRRAVSIFKYRVDADALRCGLHTSWRGLVRQAEPPAANLRRRCQPPTCLTLFVGLFFLYFPRCFEPDECAFPLDEQPSDEGERIRQRTEHVWVLGK
jgi:hypothetical protein